LTAKDTKEKSKKIEAFSYLYRFLASSFVSFVSFVCFVVNSSSVPVS